MKFFYFIDLNFEVQNNFKESIKINSEIETFFNSLIILESMVSLVRHNVLACIFVNNLR